MKDIKTITLPKITHSGNVFTISDNTGKNTIIECDKDDIIEGNKIILENYNSITLVAASEKIDEKVIGEWLIINN